MFSYIRASTLEQQATLDIQEKSNRAVGMTLGYKDFDLVNYIDAGVSGSVPLRERPAGKEMLATAKKGDILISSKLDRMFRSASDALATIERLQEAGIDVILLDVDIKPISSSGIAKLFLTILSAVAEFERTRINERIAEGKRAKKERSNYAGGMAPYGWRKVGMRRDSRLEPVEAEQEVIKLAVALRGNKNLAALTRLLEERGCYSRNGKPFHLKQVERILERVG